MAEKQKTETKAQQGEPKEKIINTQNGENRDSLINEYNSLVKETKRLDIINEKEIIEETQKLDLEKITFFAKAGLYHFNFSDGTAISVDELERLKKKEIESTKKYLEKEHDMSLLRKTPDYILIEALRYAILKRNEYFEAKDRLDVDTMLDEKIQKYIDGIRDEYIGKSFSEIIYDNISEITEIEDFNSKSLNANEI